MRKRKFSHILKTGGDRKNSATLREYREAKAAGLVHPNQHTEPLGTRVSSCGACGNLTLTKKELEGALVKAQGEADEAIDEAWATKQRSGRLKDRLVSLVATVKLVRKENHDMKGAVKAAEAGLKRVSSEFEVHKAEVEDLITKGQNVIKVRTLLLLPRYFFVWCCMLCWAGRNWRDTFPPICSHC